MNEISAQSYSIKDSIDWSVKITKKSAGNFYYSFLTLSPSTFEAMCVLYAFLRVTDDIADDESQPIQLRKKHLDQWQHQLAMAIHSNQFEHEVFPALASIIERYSIPVVYLHDVIEGVRGDLTARKFQTFDELNHYCYQVAGAVGLCCIEIWGYTDAKAKEYAIACGTAFQLTNILRDLKSDALAGRVYLPQEEMNGFEYSENDILESNRNRPFEELMSFQTERAKEYYRESKKLLPVLTPEGKAIFSAMSGIYEGIFNEIIKRQYDVYTRRVRIPKWKKLYFAISSMIRHRWLR